MGVKSMDFGIPQTKVQISAAPSTNWGALGKKKKKSPLKDCGPTCEVWIMMVLTQGAGTVTYKGPASVPSLSPPVCEEQRQGCCQPTTSPASRVTPTMKSASPTPLFPGFLPLPRPSSQLPYPAHCLEQEAQVGSPSSPSEAPVVPWTRQKSWRKQGGTTWQTPGHLPWARPHLQDGGALLVLVHLGSQPVELEGHAAQVREELAVVRLLGAHAQGGPQAPQVQHQVAVLGGQGAQLLAGEGTRAALHHSLSRCRPPFSLRFPLPHDSVSPSDPSSAEGHSPVMQVPCLGLTHRAGPGTPRPLAGLPVLEPPSSHTLGLAECLWVNHSSTGPQNPHLLRVHIPFLLFYPIGFLCE